MLRENTFVFTLTIVGLLGMTLITIESSTSSTYAQTVNTSERSPSESPFEIQSPAVNDMFTWQGLSSSLPRQLPGEEPQGQTAIILPPRDDDATYSGMLDYFSSRPVDVIAWNVIRPSNTTAIPDEFGDFNDYAFGENETVVFTVLSSGTSGTVPFNANAIELVSAEEDDSADEEGGEPFIVSYALQAYPAQSEIVNNLTSIAAAFNASSTENGDDSTGGQGQEDEEE